MERRIKSRREKLASAVGIALRDGGVGHPFLIGNVGLVNHAPALPE
jgi:hypothetical protein